MNRFKSIFTAICIAVATLPAATYAQEAATGYTPYSMFSVGDISIPGTAYNNAMAGIGIGDRNIRFINTLNPAAVTALEKKSFMMDFGLRQNNVLYNQGEKAAAYNTFNLDHLVIQLPIASKGAFRFGVNTFSSVGYQFSSQEKNQSLIAEMGDIRYAQTGEGGLYRLFLGAGVTLFDRLSLGAEGFYCFGNVSSSNTVLYYTNPEYRSISMGEECARSGVGAKFGLQYKQPVSKYSYIAVGATYQLPFTLGGESTGYTFGTSAATDTLSYVTGAADPLSIPSEIGVGISFRKLDRFMVGFDYTRQDWTSTTVSATPGVDFSPACSNSFSLGAEWTPNIFDIRYYFKQMTYRGGVYYRQSNLSFGGRQINSAGITLGVSLPVYRYFNSINFSVDIGQRGTTEDNLIRERYVLFTLSFSFHDIWFIKQMYD